MPNTKKIEKECIDFVNQCLCLQQQENLSIEESVERLYMTTMPQIPNNEQKKELLLKAFYKIYYTMSLAEEESVPFFVEEVEFLSSISKPSIKQLFYLLFFYKKNHEHHSGWIRFNFDEVIAPISNFKTKHKFKREDLQELVPFGFEMRSIGSKAAIPCFKLPDLETMGEIAFEVNMHTIGQKWEEYINVAN